MILEQSVHLFVTNKALTTGPALPGGLSVAKRYCYFRLEVWISQSCPICIYIYILPNENGFTSLIFFINLAVCLITLFIWGLVSLTDVPDSSTGYAEVSVRYWWRWHCLRASRPRHRIPEPSSDCSCATHWSRGWYPVRFLLCNSQSTDCLDFKCSDYGQDQSGIRTFICFAWQGALPSWGKAAKEANCESVMFNFLPLSPSLPQSLLSFLLLWWNHIYVAPPSIPPCIPRPLLPSVPPPNILPSFSLGLFCLYDASNTRWWRDFVREFWGMGVMGR